MRVGIKHKYYQTIITKEVSMTISWKDAKVKHIICARALSKICFIFIGRQICNLLYRKHAQKENNKCMHI